MTSRGRASAVAAAGVLNASLHKMDRTGAAHRQTGDKHGASQAQEEEPDGKDWLVSMIRKCSAAG